MNIYNFGKLASVFFIFGIYASFLHPILYWIFAFFFAISYKYCHEIVTKLVFFFAIGLFRGSFLNKNEEFYSFKKTAFEATIVDYKIINGETYVVLSNFKKIKFLEEKHVVDSFPVFPKTAIMKICNFNNSELTIGSKIHAVGRFFQKNQQIFKWKKENAKVKGVVYECQIFLKKKTIKDFIREKMNAFSPKVNAFLRAVFLSDGYKIEKTTRETFTKAGLAHILGVSVLNVSFFLYLLYRFFYHILSKYFCNLSHFNSLQFFATIFSLIFMFFYCLIIGFEFPLLRSLFISFFNLFNIFIGKKRKDEILFLSAAIILCIFPDAIFDIGFQLSFLSVLSIYAFNIMFENRFLHSIYITFVATIGTLPVSVYHFNYVCLQPFLGNIIVVPLVAFLIIPLMNIWLFLSIFSLEHFLTKIIDFLVCFMLYLVDIISSLSVLQFFPFVHYMAVICYVICLVLFYVFNLRFFFAFGYFVFLTNLFQNYKKNEFILINNSCVAYVKKDVIYMSNQNEYIKDLLASTFNKQIICNDFEHFQKHGSNLIVLNKFYVVYNLNQEYVLGNYEIVFAYNETQINL